MKRKILIVAALICLAAIFTFGTLAVFTANNSITNKFMVADYDPDKPPITPDELFSVTVYETDKDGNQTTQGLTYDSIQPGDTLDKDPTVKNTGKYDQYVRVMVTVTNAENWRNACQEHGITDLTTIFGGFVDADWTRVDAPVYDQANDTLTYTYYYNGVLAPKASATLFETVTIPQAFTVENMVALQQFELKIAADAIQSAHTGDNAVDAFAAYWGK